MDSSGAQSAPRTDSTFVLSPEPCDAKPSTEHVAKPVSALTPPTSEEMNVDSKKEHDDSELSDLDLDDDDEEEEIFPDHYWDGENGGRIPVFKPTMDQFRSFKKFVDKIDKYGMKSGIVKVIPPQEWRDSLPALDEYVKRIRIKNPITQEFNGTFGTYTQQNVEKQRSYNLPEWKSLTEETQHQPPAKRGERRRNQEKVVRGGGSLRGRASAGSLKDEDTLKSKRKPGRPRRAPLPAEDAASDDEPTTHEQTSAPPGSPTLKPAKRARGRPPAKGGQAKAGQAKAGQAKSVTSRRLNNTAEAVDVVDEKAFKNFDYRMEDLDEFTPERCAELEAHYWKSLAFNQPMYAADMPGSLFDDKTTSWNVAKLENLLDILGTKVPGVNTAYLYMGMWKATFAWHLEDVDLYSINYIHFGAPKQWYSISQEDARKFERAMKTVWASDAKICDQFLRHKTYLISPDVLQKQYGVKVNKLVHYEGEFVITYPYGYHSGYNLGYNCAESVNFATESWLEFGRIARKCNCEADNVWVDVSEIERKLRGEPTPEYYEETDDDDEELDEEEDGNLPTPPASVKGQKPKTKKRKRETKQEAPKKKKKIRIKIRAPTREPCCMCPNDNPWEPLLVTDTGKKAHRSCALYTPETYIVVIDGKEKICGVANIDKARLDLKCNLCRSKRGACFQCSSKKCTRAFHASCAVAAGVLVDAGPVPTFGEDGTEYFEDGYDFRCRYHRPKMPKNLNVDVLESSKRIYNYARDLKRDDTVQAQLVGGEVFGGLVIENRPTEMTVIVDVLPDGNRVEVEWKWLCTLDPDDSLRPKPSAAALPMPENMHKSKFSMANRQDGVPTQDESFHDDPSFKWHDFYNMHMPPPGYQTIPHQTPCKLNIDLGKPDQLYYYLPQVSTESKPLFTDKPGSNVVAPKANFADRVSAVPKPALQQFITTTGKHPLAPAARPAGNGYITNQAQLNSTAAGSRTEKPYVYKPKEPARPNDPLCAVDYQSLANQRNFLAENGRRSSNFSLPQPQHQAPPYGYQGSDPSRNTTPVRPFPPSHYYSSTVLPAAFAGDYSTYRRESQGSQTMPRYRLDNTAFNPTHQSAPNAPLKNGAPTVPYMSGSTNMPTNALYSAAMPPTLDPSNVQSRPSSSAQSHNSPTGAPLTPISSQSRSDRTQQDLGYVHNLQKYPYLMNSSGHKSKPLELQNQDEAGGQTSPAAQHTPNNSVTAANDAFSSDKQQWTPPSQRPEALKQQNSPPMQCRAMPNRHLVQPVHSTPQEFLHQINGSGIPSMAGRSGAHARMLKDPGYMGFGPHDGLQRSTFDQAYDTSKMWQSPRAPTPSPLSDTNASVFGNGQTPFQPSVPWAMPTRADANNGDSKPSGTGYGAGFGPMLPQMHGGNNEGWGYG